MQSAAVVLTQEEILISLEIFKESIKYLKSWSQVENIIVLYIPSPINLYIWEEPITYEFKNSTNGVIGEIGQTTNDKNTSNSIFIRNKINSFSKENNFYFLDTTRYLTEKGKKIILHGPLDWRHFNYEVYKNASKYLIENIPND